MSGVSKYTTRGGRAIYQFAVTAFPTLVANIHVIDDGGSLTLVDTGSGLDQSNQELLTGFDALRDEFGVAFTLDDIDTILITHGHVDHFGGLPFVRRHTDAPIAVHVLDRRSLSHYEERVVVASKQLDVYLQRCGLSDGARTGLMQMYSMQKSMYRSVDVELEPAPSTVWLVIGEGDGFDLSWTGAPRHLIIGERPDLPVGSSTDYESLRIAAGEPLVGIDVEQSTIPEEAGLVDVSVDFTKGCYLGQELVARINSRGRNVPRRLRLLDLAAPTAASAPIVLGDKEVGTLTSAIGLSGMALIHRDVEPGDTVSVGGIEAAVREIPPKPKT